MNLLILLGLLGIPLLLVAGAQEKPKQINGPTGPILSPAVPRPTIR